MKTNERIVHNFFRNLKSFSLIESMEAYEMYDALESTIITKTLKSAIDKEIETRGK